MTYLKLETGEVLEGVPIGSSQECCAELVFTTGMSGYVESLTDPSYSNQILTFTYPLIGNYGVPEPPYESQKVHVAGVILGEVSPGSHWTAIKTFDAWLKENNVPGITGIDTRKLTKIIREHGVLKAAICHDKNTVLPPLKPDFITCQEPYVIGSGEKTVLVVDCGIKNGQFRLARPNLQLKVVPHNWDFTTEDFDYLFISNGPGDPTSYNLLIKNLKTFIEKDLDIPIFGICLGHQILALAIGAKTYKLKYGNRGVNIPCQLAGTKRCFITSQNHGYAVDAESLPPDWRPLFINANDGSNEGIYHVNKPYYSVQFHPEAKPGPEDTAFFFDLFLERRFNDLWQIANPQVEKPKKILILGSGGLSIGQSGEFDYSGSQAIKAYKEEGVETVLINPNIATVQTSTKMANGVYFLPVSPEYVEEVIKIERPDAITVSFGGQSALNCGVQLYKNGILKKYNVRILGTPIEAVIKTEDRGIFKAHLETIGEPSIESHVATSHEEAVEISKKIGFPLLIRAAYALGGLGSGFVHNSTELNKQLKSAFAHSSQVIIDKSLRGWKEVEYEVVRDAWDNCICVCNMENFDPLGVHTGESIVIAPSQTLDDADYQMLRTSAIKTIRSLGIVGECNIQFALDPASRQYYIIEVNARLSRSSALASKATGYPLAHIAAKLSLGYSLFDLKNSITETSALFEPALDYCVVKIPRWDLQKFPTVDRTLDSSMKSIGEGMAISRSFPEALQKALRMTGLTFNVEMPGDIATPTPTRILHVLTAMYNGCEINKINRETGIDKWFLVEIKKCIDYIHLCKNNKLSNDLLITGKKLGFSDVDIGRFFQSPEAVIRGRRLKAGILPFVKCVDTVAGEFPCRTNYLYTTYNACEHDITFEKDTALILGSGVYHIGSSVEFDWSSVQAVRTLRENGWHTTIINCNPETVSTDYDEANQLYFDELTPERVLDIYNLEKPKGVVLSMGGQVANNMAMALYREYVKIIGTSPEVIDMAENRYKFSRLLDKLKIEQPVWREATSVKEAGEFCDTVGFPCLIRPSYVLSGASMNICWNHSELAGYLANAKSVNKEHPVVISKFISGAKEIEVDAVAHSHEIRAIAISEHVENAGVHSGDSTIIHPAVDITEETRAKITTAVQKLVTELDIQGPFNMQFMVKDEEIKVIECNLRVSRTLPFISKTCGVNFVEIAVKNMIGLKAEMPPVKYEVVGVKTPKFSVSRLKNADFKLGVDMTSTGEVAGFGKDKYEAYYKALQGSDITIPKTGSILLSIGTLRFKREFLESVRILKNLGFELYGTRGTADFYNEHKIEINEINNLSEIKNLNFVINISRAGSHVEGSNGFTIRRTAIDNNIPILTDIKTAKLFVKSIELNRCAKVSLYDRFSSNRIVRLPGLIDVHVHMREPGGEHKEDWLTGTRSALAGGITTVCAMPNTDPAIVDEKALSLVEKLAAEKAYCDYMLYVGAGNGNAGQVHKLEGRAAGIKFYLNATYGPLLIDNTLIWAEHMKHWGDRPICTHAEGQTLAAILYLGKMYNKHIHVCHVSSRQEIELVKLAKRSGQRVTCEVAPHHLFMSNADLARLGSCGSVKPPLMDGDDADALWENLEYIDCFATDHAPHLYAEKCSTKPPGFPGLETALPLLITAMNEGRLTLDDIVLRYYTNPKKIFNIETSPNTFIEVDIDQTFTIDNPRFSKADWTPFKGWQVQGVVKRVYLRNELVYANGEVLGRPGFGKNLRLGQSVKNQAYTKLERPVKEYRKLHNLITATGLSKDLLTEIFELTDEMRLKKRNGDPTLSTILKNKILGLVFYEPSTRTRCSFSAAMKRLGGETVEITADTSSVKKGEDTADFIRSIACYTDAIVLRNNGGASMAELSKISKVPLISAGDGAGEHPTQAILDAYTIRRELGTLNGLTIGICGDLKYGRTVHSLVKLLSQYTVDFRFISPPELSLPKGLIENPKVYDSITEVLPELDVLYMTRIQKERIEGSIEVGEKCMLTPEKLLRAKNNCIIMHPLPRNEEISRDIDNDPRAAYFRQMKNGMYVRMALLTMIFS